MLQISSQKYEHYLTVDKSYFNNGIVFGLPFRVYTVHITDNDIYYGGIILGAICAVIAERKDSF